MLKVKPSYQDLEKRIRELESENKLKQIENRFNLLLKASEDMITIHKPNGEYIYYNGPTCYPITTKNVVGKMPNDLFNEEIATRLLQTFHKVEETGESETIEVLLDWLGAKKWFSEYIYPIKNDDGKVVELVKVCRDINQRKIAEQTVEKQSKEKEKQLQELKLSKQKIQDSLDLLEKSKYSMDEASKVAKIGYHNYDNITNTFTWSEYLYHIFGMNPKEDLLRTEVLTYFDETSRKKIIKATKNLNSNGIPYDLELRIINKKKKEVWVRNVTQPIYNQQNEIIGRRGVTQDITDTKKAQLELEKSKLKIETTLELVKENEYSLKEAGRMAKIGYWRFYNLTETLFWSDAIYQIYGCNPKFGVPKTDAILNVYNKASKKRILKALEKLTNKGISYDIELEFINFKNEKKWIRNIGEPLYNSKNEVVGRRGVSQDITDQKIRQRELDKKNEKLYELNNALNEAQKLSHVGSWQWNMITDKAEWSDEMYNIYGVTKENFYPSNENVTKTVLLEDMHKVEKGISSLLIDKMFVPFEFRIKRPTGEIRHLYIVALEKNSQESIFGVTKDITEQKKIEQKNKIITDRYRELFDNATVSIWNEDFTLVFKKIKKLKKLTIPNIKTYLEQNPEILFSLLEKVKVNKVNKATLKLFKANSSEEFFENIHSTFGEGADQVFIGLIEAIWNNQKTFTSEVNYKTLKGEEFAAIVSISIPQTETEQKTVPVSIQSIQKIKDAELEKRETLDKLKESQELAHVGSWLYNLSTQKSEWSEETFRIWGFDLNKPTPNGDEILNRIHIDDQEQFHKTADLAYKYGTPYNIEFRICLPNNTQKTIKSICKPIVGDDGKVICLRGTNQDITEQKRIRNKIEKNEEMYRLLTDNSNDLICLQEPDSSFKYISPSIKKILGYNQSDFLGKKVYNIVHNDDIEPLKIAMENEIFSNSNNKAFSLRLRHKKGHFVWLEFLTSPVYKAKEISYYVTSARDISQSVLAKQEIQKYQTSLQKMTTEMTLIEEKQKKEIASNIHDHLSQSLVISKMKISELKKNPALNGIQKDLKFIEKHISEALENSRKVTYELSPPVLYQLGIVDALNWLLESVETTHKIECRIHSNVNSITLSDVKSILLYRCIQEVTKNAIKYANASLLTLHLNKSESGINILLTDNGDGFDTSQLNNYENHSGSGFGLFTVQERIKNIQGIFKITSKINSGTSVEIFIPLSK